MSDDADWMRGQVMMYGAPSAPSAPKWPNPPVYPFAPPGVPGTPPLPSSAGILVGAEDLANLRREMQIGFESLRASHRDSVEELTRVFQSFLEFSMKAARREAYEDAIRACQEVAAARGVVGEAHVAAAKMCAQKIAERVR